jgi:hypothetical protein
MLVEIYLTHTDTHEWDDLLKEPKRILSRKLFILAKAAETQRSIPAIFFRFIKDATKNGEKHIIGGENLIHSLMASLLTFTDQGNKVLNIFDLHVADD